MDELEIARLRRENEELRRALSTVKGGIAEAPEESGVEVTRTQIVCVVCRKLRQVDVVPVQTDPGPALAFARKHAAEHDGWIEWPVAEDPNGMRCSRTCESPKVCRFCDRVFPAGVPLSHGMEGDVCSRSASVPSTLPPPPTPMVS